MPAVTDRGWWWLSILWLVISISNFVGAKWEPACLKLLLAGTCWLLAHAEPPRGRP